MQKIEVTGQMKDVIDLIGQNNYKVIIIEGVRGVGKSTFGQYLSKYFHIPFITAWQNRKELGVNYLQAQLDIAQTGFGFLDMYSQMHKYICDRNSRDEFDPKLIIDRGYVTAVVFQNDYSLGKVRLYRELLKKCNGVIIYLRNKKMIDNTNYYKDIDLKEEDRLFRMYLDNHFSDMYHTVELDTTPDADGIMYYM